MSICLAQISIFFHKNRAGSRIFVQIRESSVFQETLGGGTETIKVLPTAKAFFFGDRTRRKGAKSSLYFRMRNFITNLQVKCCESIDIVFFECYTMYKHIILIIEYADYFRTITDETEIIDNIHNCNCFDFGGDRCRDGVCADAKRRAFDHARG